MFKLAAIITCTLLLAGCNSLGKPYKTMKDVVDAPPSDGNARLIFLRPADHDLGAARSPDVDLDGKTIGSLAFGGFFFHDIAPGTHRLKTEIWDMPGKCLVDINAEAGATYYFIVDPRTEVFWASMAGGIIGAAIESSGKECGGAFKLFPVDPETARSKMAKLRYSE